jgi:hypothetical protein
MTGRVQTMKNNMKKLQQKEKKRRKRKAKEKTLRIKKYGREKGQSERGEGYAKKRKVEEKRKNMQRDSKRRRKIGI